jgi:O-antigen/teichoic acid export membrane protein
MKRRADSSELVSFARGFVLNLGGSAASAVLTFALTILVARGFASSGAGIFFQMTALFTILTMVVQFGAQDGIVWMLSRCRSTNRTGDVRPSLIIAAAPVTALSSVIAVALYFLADEVAAVLIHGASRTVAATDLRVLAVLLPIAAVSGVLLPATRAFGSMVPTNVVEGVGKPTIRFLIAAAVVAAGLGQVALGAVWLIPTVVGFGATIYFVRTALASEPTVDMSPATEARLLPRDRAGELGKEFWRFSSFRALAAICQVGIVWLDVLLLGALTSTRDAGIYSAAGRYMTIGALFLGAISQVFAPQISRLLATNDTVQAQEVFHTATGWLTAAAGPIAVSMFAFAPAMMNIFGHSFEAGVSVLRILAIAMAFNMVTGPVGVVLLMGGKSSWNMANAAFGLVLNVVLNVILIPRYGMTGAAVAWAATIVATNVGSVVLVWRFWRLQPFGSVFRPVALVGLACYAVVGIAANALGLTSLQVAAVSVCIASVPYLLFLWQLRSPLRLGTLRHATRRVVP